MKVEPVHNSLFSNQDKERKKPNRKKEASQTLRGKNNSKKIDFMA